MINWAKKKWFRFKYRKHIFYSKFLDHDIRIVKVIDWDDWVWEIDESYSNHRFGRSDYDVRKFVRGAK